MGEGRRGTAAAAGRKASSWTSLLDDDDDAQAGNYNKKRAQPGFERKIEQAWRSEIDKATPPELRDSYMNKMNHMHPEEKERLAEKEKLEALDRASQVVPPPAGGVGGSSAISPHEQDADGHFYEKPPLPTNIPARAGLWSGESPAAIKPRRSFYGSAEEEGTNQLNKRSQQEQRRQADKEHLDEYAMRVGNQHRPRRESAMSRFFRDNQSREFAARKFEEEDKARYSAPMPKFDDAMRQAGFGLDAQRADPNDQRSPVQQAKVMLDELDGTTTSATSGPNSRARSSASESPYDSYRQLSVASAGDTSFEINEQTKANRSTIPGLGPLLDTIYWRIEQSSEYKTNRPQKEDKAIPFYKRVFADVDLYDRRSTMHILANYKSAEWIFALFSAAAVFFMTEYQYKHRMLETYDEILGLDARRGGERLEYLMVMVVSFFVYRFFLFHPFVVSAIGLTRTGRFLTGRPLGPP